MNVCGFSHVTMHALIPLRKKDTNVYWVVQAYISLFHDWMLLWHEDIRKLCFCKMLIKIQKYIWMFVELSSASSDTERSKLCFILSCPSSSVLSSLFDLHSAAPLFVCDWHKTMLCTSIKVTCLEISLHMVVFWKLWGVFLEEKKYAA